MRKKLFIGNFLLIFVVLLVTMIFSTKLAQDNYRNEVEKQLTGVTFSLEYYLLNAQNNNVNLDSLAKDYVSRVNADINTAQEGLRLTFVDYEGKVLGDSEGNIQEMDNHLNRKEISEAIATGRGTDIRSSKTVGIDFLYVAVPMSQRQFIIRAAVPLAQLELINQQVRKYAVITFLIALLLAALLAWKLTSTITSPLIEMTNVSKEIARGNYKKRIKVHSHDEIGELALNFNEMGAKLGTTVDDLNRKKLEVEAIINSLPNGLIAVDRQMKIILINPSASKFFGVQREFNVEGVNLAQHIRNNRINTLLRDTITANKTLVDRIDYDQKNLYIRTNPIGSVDGKDTNAGGVAFIQDITKTKKLERMRTEFVSNVTHELKTPITSIRGFIETLRNGAMEDKEVAARFLDIIDIEAARLHDLIEDTLQLSEIETKQEDSDIGTFRLKEAADEVFAILQPFAEEKEVTLSYHGDENLTIDANKNRIKQLLMNLVDNGIKYNKPQGTVEVAAYREKGRIVITVTDTGIGIPEEHLPRIFERFYRVDQSRTRDTGGTGLGLSIVKHIVKLYHGDISVKSELDKGTVFTIQLPVN